MKKLSIKIAIFTLFLGVIGLLTYKQFKKPEIEAISHDISAQFEGADMDVREFYLDRFNQKETELNQKIASIVDLNSCIQTQKQLTNEFRDYALAQRTVDSRVSQSTRDLIIEIGRDFDISPHDFVIKFQDMGASPAAVEECIFYVNEKLLHSYSEKAQRFIIAHEFSHMVHHDGAFLTALEKQLDMNNERDRNLFNQFGRFQEARADVFASTKNLEYAEGGLEFFKELYNRHGDQSGITHPKNSDRITAHNTIIGLHTNNQTVA